ncbi:flagellar basal body rod protein FlgB [Paenibacillus tarimensis]
MKLLTGTDFQKLHGALKAAELRQQVISNNLANADTPYFKRSEVVFEDFLNRELANNNALPLKLTHQRHIGLTQTTAAPKPSIVTDERSVMNNNVNNVDIDREMSLLAKNQLRYNLFIQQVNHDVKMLRTAVEGRG